MCPEHHYWGIFDLTAIKEGPLLSYHVFKFICIKLSEAWIFFEVWVFWRPEILNLALHRASTSSLFGRMDTMTRSCEAWPRP